MTRLTATDKFLLRNYFMKRPIRKAYVFAFGRLRPGKATDLDLVIELENSDPTGIEFFGYRLELEKLLKKKVGLVSAARLSARVKPFVEREKVLIYERGV